MQDAERKSIIEKRVAILTEYWGTYLDQQGYENYSDDIFIDDALYAIGISLDDKYRYADGYREFRKFLSERKD